MRITFFSMRTFVLGLFISSVFISCSSDDDDSEDVGNWIKSTVFDGSPRSSAASFSIGDFGYVGTGYDGYDYLNDFWQYDFNGGYWVQKANFPGEARSSASTFVVGENGYLGTGYDGVDVLKDMYKYNPADNSWTPIAEFEGTARRAAVGFNSDVAGYIGSGFDGDNDKKDFWKYDPIEDKWTEQYGFGGEKRREAVTFAIGDNVYFGTGSSNSLNLTDFWAFNTNTEVWTKLKDLDDDDDYSVERSNATAFALNGYGYVCTGNGSNTVWEYDPATDEWEEKQAFEGSFRLDANSISNGVSVFVLLGKSSTYYFDDMYEFKPFEEYDDED